MSLDGVTERGEGDERGEGEGMWYEGEWTYSMVFCGMAIMVDEAKCKTKSSVDEER